MMRGLQLHLHLHSLYPMEGIRDTINPGRTPSYLGAKWHISTKDYLQKDAQLSTHPTAINCHWTCPLCLVWAGGGEFSTARSMGMNPFLRNPWQRKCQGRPRYISSRSMLCTIFWIMQCRPQKQLSWHYQVKEYLNQVAGRCWSSRDERTAYYSWSILRGLFQDTSSATDVGNITFARKRVNRPSLDPDVIH